MSILSDHAADDTHPLIGTLTHHTKHYSGANGSVQVSPDLYGWFLDVEAVGVDIEYGFQIVKANADGTFTAPAVLTYQNPSTFASPARVGAPLAAGACTSKKVPCPLDETYRVYFLWVAASGTAHVGLTPSQGVGAA